MPNLSAIRLSWSTVSRSPAYATAVPRAPDGHASPYRCGSFVDAPHWRLVESANPCAIASACRPCRSIQARRILAPSRVSLPRASKPGCFGSAMQSRFDRVDFLCANAKNKTPPGAGTRGRSRGLGRSG